jgi:hypothetical protein
MAPTTSNPNFDNEKPEGSRETVDESLDHARRDEQGISTPSAEKEAEEQADAGNFSGSALSNGAAADTRTVEAEP